MSIFISILFILTCAPAFCTAGKYYVLEVDVVTQNFTFISSIDIMTGARVKGKLQMRDCEK